MPLSPAERTPGPAPSLEATSGRLGVLCARGPICPFQVLAHNKSVLFIRHSSHLPEAWFAFTAPLVYHLSVTSPWSTLPPFLLRRGTGPSLTRALVTCHQHQCGVPKPPLHKANASLFPVALCAPDKQLNALPWHPLTPICPLQQGLLGGGVGESGCGLSPDFSHLPLIHQDQQGRRG